MSDDRPPANPYVGPRPLHTGEQLFGRDRERTRLLHLLIAERIVLLYSPSGAGKTSLIEAGLVPELEGHDFRVLPRVRAGQAPPDDAPPRANRFLASTLAALDQARPPDQRRPLAQLLEAGLPAYLDELVREGAPDAAQPPPEEEPPPPNPVLIFDQFEEVLTADPADLDARRDFFRELGAALENRGVWALFALREDFLAALDPFLGPIPNRFRDHMRLALLSAEAAALAVRGPAAAAGVPFEDAAAERLVDDLRATIVPRLDGRIETVDGHFVEPVQLQVVCARLWQKLAPTLPGRERRTITRADVEGLGNVNTALTDYYKETVARAAAAGARELAIRDWFVHQLITPDGLRNKVLKGGASSGDLSNAVIDVLVDAHLVRGEDSRGLVWYELTHDRLIAPIRDEYLVWSAANLFPFREAAAAWDKDGRPPDLLLVGAELALARAWDRDHHDHMRGHELAFLDAAAAQEQAAIEQEQAAIRARQRRRWRLFIGIVVGNVALLLLLLFSLFALRAEQNARVSRVLHSAALALDDRERLPQRSVLVALAAYAESQRALLPALGALSGLLGDNPSVPVAEETLRESLSSLGGVSLVGHLTQLDALAFSPSGEWLATASLDGTARLWRVDAPERPAVVLRGHSQEVQALAFSPDSRLLVTASDDFTLRVWQLDALEEPPAVLRGHSLSVMGAAFSPDGRWIASSGQDGRVLLWDVGALDAPPTLLGGFPGQAQAELRALAFGPHNQLAVGFNSGAVLLWQLDARGTQPAALPGHTSPVHALAFSPDGRALLSGGDGGALLFGPLDGPAIMATPLATAGMSVVAAAFSPDGALAAVGGNDSRVLVWRAGAPDQPPRELPGHQGPVAALAFSGDGARLAAGGGDGVTHLWRVAALGADPVVLRGHEGPVSALAFSADSAWLATASWDTTAHLWRVAAPESVPLTLREPPAEAAADGTPAVRFLSDTGLVTAYRSGAVRRWDVAAPERQPAAPQGQRGGATALALEPGGGLLAIGAADGLVQVWPLDALDAEPARQWQHDSSQGMGRVSALAFSPDGRWLASGSWDGTARLWQVGSDAPPASIAGLGLVRALAFSPDSRRLIVAGDDRRVQLWDVAAPDRAPLTLGTHDEGVTAAAFSPDDRWLATGGNDFTARLWRLDRPGGEPVVLRGYAGAVVALAFSPDSRWLAIGSTDGTAQLWQMDRLGAAPVVLRGHTSGVQAVAFSPDGRYVATASDDGAARLWRTAALDSGPVRLRGHTRAVAALAFSPGGRLIATAGWDGTTRVWDVEPAALVDAACQMVWRNLTLQEWQQFIGPEATYRPICANLPLNPTVYEAMLREGRIDEALGSYTLAWQNNSALDPPAAWLVWMAGAIAQGDPAAAAAAYRRALTLDPGLGSAHALGLNRLCAFANDAQYASDVIRACDRAVAIDPGQGNFRYNRAAVREQLGDRAGAAQDLCFFIPWAAGHPNAEARQAEAAARIRALVPDGAPCAPGP